jgi:hypothetical protein
MKKLFFTYFFIIAGLCVHAQQNTEEKAIIKLLETEAATWRTADAKAHAACWHIQPYSRILVSLADGKVIDVPPVAMTDTFVHKMGNGGSAVMSNIKIKISGNSGWVSHDETSTDKEGNKSFSYEIRLLEKINGAWKLTAQSIHLYHPK